DTAAGGDPTGRAPGDRSRARRRAAVPTAVAANAAIASRTMVAPGAVSNAPDTQMPVPAATTPMAIARCCVARKLRVSSCAVATGTTISALTSSRPTARIATVTVTAVATAVSRLRARTGSPAA